MAAMATALTEFNDSLNSRTYTYTGHTVSKPKLIIQKRRVPTGNQTMAEDVISIIAGTEDSDGVVLDQKESYVITHRRPIDGIAADRTALLAIIKDVVNGDEFANTGETQEYLK